MLLAWTGQYACCVGGSCCLLRPPLWPHLGKSQTGHLQCWVTLGQRALAVRLLQVIYQLNSKNEDFELDLAEQANNYELEIEQARSIPHCSLGLRTALCALH